jgi:CheY-like chemotaxis protein
LASQRSVLIVDRSPENREVLQTALERRGLRTLAAARIQSGLELARRHEPDLVVLDLETAGSDAADVSTPFLRHNPQHPTMVVVLGAVRCNYPAEPQREFVAKPYHYGPLIRRIEELVTAAGQESVRPA